MNRWIFALGIACMMAACSKPDDGGNPPKKVEVPIIQDRVTGEIMELDLGSHLIRNACYLIGYLPNTGIAVIDKRIS